MKVEFCTNILGQLCAIVHTDNPPALVELGTDLSCDNDQIHVNGVTYSYNVGDLGDHRIGDGYLVNSPHSVHAMGVEYHVAIGMVIGHYLDLTLTSDPSETEH